MRARIATMWLTLVLALSLVGGGLALSVAQAATSASANNGVLEVTVAGNTVTLRSVYAGASELRSMSSEGLQLRGDQLDERVLRATSVPTGRYTVYAEVIGYNGNVPWTVLESVTLVIGNNASISLAKRTLPLQSLHVRDYVTMTRYNPSAQVPFPSVLFADSQPPLGMVGYIHLVNSNGSYGPFPASYHHTQLPVAWCSSDTATVDVDWIYGLDDVMAGIAPQGRVLNNWRTSFVAMGYCPGPSFLDIPKGTQFYGEIEWLSWAGVSTGWAVPGGKVFRAVQPVNRDAMAAFLYRMAGSPPFTPPAVSPFRDVTPTTQFYKEITWLATRGITTGWTVPGGREFRPLQAVNRDAMAAFLFRFAEVDDYFAPDVSPFRDITPTTQFFREIAWLADSGISTGWTVGSTAEYRPLNPVNRDAMAAFLYRYSWL